VFIQSVCHFGIMYNIIGTTCLKDEALLKEMTELLDDFSSYVPLHVN